MSKTVLFGGGFLIFFVGMLAGAALVGKGPAHAGAPSQDTVKGTAIAEPQPAPEPVVQEPSPAEQVMALESAQAALYATRGMMGDSIDQISSGAALFALWAGRHMTWPDVYVSQNQTSVALVKKDSAEELGDRMCVTGRIIQIAKESSEPKLYAGNVMTGSFDIVNFVAAGSTGALVEDSRAKFCGYVTGVYSFANVSGGQTQSVQMVGMFDLAENKL